MPWVKVHPDNVGPREWRLTWTHTSPPSAPLPTIGPAGRGDPEPRSVTTTDIDTFHRAEPLDLPLLLAGLIEKGDAAEYGDGWYELELHELLLGGDVVPAGIVLWTVEDGVVVPSV